jgi:predicted nucleotidyltransferase
MSTFQKLIGELRHFETSERRLKGIERIKGGQVDLALSGRNVDSFDNPSMHASLAAQLPIIAALCEKLGVAHLELFGSATGSDFNPDSSDFDFLVELDTNAPGSRAKRWTELADALEQLLGRPVDLVNPRYIRNPYFLQAVNNTRTTIYDRQVAQTAG